MQGTIYLCCTGSGGVTGVFPAMQPGVLEPCTASGDQQLFMLPNIAESPCCPKEIPLPSSRLTVQQPVSPHEDGSFQMGLIGHLSQCSAASALAWLWRLAAAEQQLQKCSMKATALQATPAMLNGVNDL